MHRGGETHLRVTGRKNTRNSTGIMEEMHHRCRGKPHWEGAQENMRETEQKPPHKPR